MRFSEGGVGVSDSDRPESVDTGGSNARISLPLYEGLTAAQQSQVVDGLLALL